MCSGSFPSWMKRNLLMTGKSTWGPATATIGQGRASIQKRTPTPRPIVGPEPWLFSVSIWPSLDRATGLSTVKRQYECLALNSFPIETQFLQFPLAVGKKWQVDYQFQTRGSTKQISRHAETTVTGMEE